MEQKDLENKVLAHEEILIDLKAQMSRTSSVVNEYFSALQRMRDKESGKLPDIDYRVVRLNAAIEAMQGILSNPEHRLDYDNSVGDNALPAIAIVSAKLADALVEELKKEK